MLQRVGIGYCLATLAMIAAFIVEIARKNAPISKTMISDCDENVYVSEMSIFWQIPQFVAFGISEVLAAITALNFFISQSPQHMRSVILAIYYATHSISSWMVSLLILIVNIDKNNKWISNDLNNGHLELYFLTIAIMMTVVTICFIYSAKKYKYKNNVDMIIKEKIEYENENENENKKRLIMFDNKNENVKQLESNIDD